MNEPGQGLFISTGVMTQLALEACPQLALEGLNCGVLPMHTLKPLDNEALSLWLPSAASVITVEEHSRIGGLGSAVLECRNDYMPKQSPKIRRNKMPDKFAVQYGSQNSLLNYWGITVESLCHTMKLQLQTK